MYRLELNHDVLLGQVIEYEIADPTEVIEYVRSRYPQAVMYADDGWIGRVMDAGQLERATVERRRVLIWETEAIGKVTRED